MKTNRALTLESKMASAIQELQALIQQHYPTAQFEVMTAPDDARAVHLLATVDIDDTDEVVDLVIDRMTEMRTDEEIPILVIPLRTPERVATLLKKMQATQRATMPAALS